MMGTGNKCNEGMCNYVMFTVQSLSMSYVDKGDND